MKANRLGRSTGTGVYDDNREINEVRTAQILHFWITEDLGVGV